jgi:hypothetical protein
MSILVLIAKAIATIVITVALLSVAAALIVGVFLLGSICNELQHQVEPEPEDHNGFKEG